MDRDRNRDHPPSAPAAARRLEAPSSMPGCPPCPFCSAAETEIMSVFGAHASVSTYWCQRCRSPFEALKWRGGA